jgi:uncharacterized repeat protein (TIGR01451 family)
MNKNFDGASIGRADLKPGGECSCAQWVRVVRQALVAVLAVWVSLGWLPAYAQVNAVDGAKARALAWLQAQVASDGSIAGASPMAHDAQVRAEVVQALVQTGGRSSVPGALVSRLTTNLSEPTELLSRAALALGAVGAPSNALVEQLLARQAFAGGFTPDGELAPTVLDTAWAYHVLSRSAQASAASASRQFLLNAVQPDGSVDAGGDGRRTQSTAITAIALQSAQSDPASGTAVERMLAYLLRSQQANGAWLESMYLSAVALQALTQYGSDQLARSQATQYLLNRQSVDGSWGADAFLTAVVLRALAATTTSPGDASIVGQVHDPVSGRPLEGATVTLSGSSVATVVTGADGGFSLNGLAVGTTTLSIARQGYATFSTSLQLLAGQTVQLGQIALTSVSGSSIVRGRVTAASDGRALQGALVRVASGSSTLATATTNSIGDYELVIPAGSNLTLNASMAGFETVAASASPLAGQTLLFSPSLYAAGTGPSSTSARLVGRIVARGTGLPIPGATIQLDASAPVAADAAGRFEVSTVAGSYRFVVAATGYTSVQGFVTLTPGGTLDAGVIALAGQSTTSSVRGIVTDALTGRAVAGATVSVGAGSARTGSDGSYALAGLSGLTFDVRATAEGYVGQAVQLQLGRAGDIRQDFLLAAQVATAVDLKNFGATPISAGPRSTVTASGTIVNESSGPIEVVAYMRTRDPQGAFVSQIGAISADGQPLGAIRLVPGEQRAVTFRLDTMQGVAGAYTLVGVVAVAGTSTQQMPEGQVLVSRSTSIRIEEKSILGGSVSADPPVSQSGSPVAVKLSAALQNRGNTVLPAQNYRLRIINETTGVVAFTKDDVLVEALSINQLRVVALPSWTVTGNGSFRLELSGTSTSDAGTVLGKLYVGEASMATFTVDRKVVPAGSQTVKAAVTVLGQDVLAGTITDPLAEPIRQAIQDGVKYGDATASNWVAQKRCTGCHVASQALVGGELTRKYTEQIDAYQRRSVFNALSMSRTETGAGGNIAQGVESMLAAWALNAWHKKAEHGSELSHMADYLVSAQTPSGAWNSDHNYGWWRTATSVTAFNTKNLVELSPVVSATSQLTRPQSETWLSDPRISRALAISKLRSGELVVSSYATNSVLGIDANKQVRVLAQNLAGPHGTLVLEDDSILIASNQGGIYRRDPNGTVSQFANVRAHSIARSGDGFFYATGHNSQTIYRISPAGEATVYLSSDYLSGGPTGIAVDVDGSLVVANYNRGEILRIRADKTIEILVQGLPGSPRGLISHAGAWYVATSGGIVKYSADWIATRVTFAQSDGLVFMDDGTIMAVDDGSRVLQVRQLPIDKDAKLAAYNTAIQKAVDWLLVDANTGAADNMVIAHRLIGLGAAKQHYRGTTREATIVAKMQAIGAELRSRQRVDGGWGWTVERESDSMVTAMVGVALDNLDPSPQDPVVRKALQLLLDRQVKTAGGGYWRTENLVFTDTNNLPATTWVEIWLPIALERLGGIDTDLSLRFAPNVTMTSPSLPVTSVTPESNGDTTYRWTMTGVTAAGRSVEFDLSLRDLAVNEARPVAREAYLTFKNSFDSSRVRSNVDIPTVTASAFMTVSVGTDRVDYGDSQLVTVAAAVTNSSAAASSGAVELSIETLDGVPAAALGRIPFSSLAPSASVSIPANWNTGTMLVGPYVAVAKLFDSAGQFVAVARSGFSINAANTAHVGSTLSADRAQYTLGQTVQLRSRMFNATTNMVLDKLRATTEVVNADGSLMWNRTEPEAQLAVGGSREYLYSLSTGSVLPAGEYRAILTVRDGAGQVRSMSTKIHFTVLGTDYSGVGLRGSLTVPNIVNVGSSASIGYDVTNGGAAALSNVPLILRIVDPATGVARGRFDLIANLPVGDTQASAVTWTASGNAGDVIAVLAAVIKNKEVVLAQAPFKLTSASTPVDLQLSKRIDADARVLVLVSCPAGTSTVDDPACVQQRVSAIDQTLTTLGVPHRIVTTAESFTTEQRCGAYNTYWISGGAIKLSAQVVKELREAVRRGEGLIVDGIHDSRNQLLHPVAGVKQVGKLPQQNYAEQIPAGTVFDVGTVTTAGQPTKFQLTTGQAIASFVVNGKAGDPAIVTQHYGEGASILHAYDLVAMLAAPGGATNVRNLDLVRGSLQTVAPTSQALTLGDVIRLTTSVHNRGSAAVTVNVSATLPAGVSLVDASPGATSVVTGIPTSVVWRLTIPAQGTVELSMRVKLDAVQPGALQIPLDVASVGSGGVLTPQGRVVHELTISSQTQLSDAALLAVQALAPTKANDRQAQAQALAAVQEAQRLLQQGQAAAALEQWIKAADWIAGITSDDVAKLAAAQLAIAKALEGTSDAACRL